MSNYTQTTNFATKDALASGNPLKVVKGTEINVEFANIATAIATKSDIASPTFTGTVTIPTLSAAAITGVSTLASNPVLSAGSVNGVAYLNGSKSLTSGAALTFDGTNFATTGTVTGSGFSGSGALLTSLNATNISSGTLAKARLPTGTLLQLVNGITPSNYTTASSTDVATGYGLSITPTSSSSKILILLTGSMDSGVANNQASVSARRGTTSLGSGSGNGVFSSGGRVIGNPSVMFLDSPATTSSTTYNMYFNAGSSSTITWYAGATITLMEIAA